MGRQTKALIATCALLALAVTMGVGLAAATAPTVSIDAPSSVSYTSAHVSGKVDPEDREATYRFEYQVAAEWWMGWTSGTSQGPLAANSGQTTVEDDLTGLKPGTEYAVRLVAENFDGETISSEPNPTFTTDAVAPPAVTIDAPSAVTSSGAHFSGTIDPEAPGGNPAAFDVSWEFQCTPECPGLSGTIPADSDPHAVEADATGLQPGVAYKVTLVASNAGGSASAGPESFSTGLDAPVIVSQQVSPSTTEAALSAQINPGGQATYHFEYGPTAAYGTSTATKALTGSTPVTVKANMLGLTPGAGYHFRVVAENSAGTVVGDDVPFATSSSQGSGTCPNDQIRTEQGSAGLPDCRAYEMVSPPDKNGNDIGGWLNRVKIAPGGNRVSYASSGAFAGTPESGTGKDVDYLADRSGDTWLTKPITPLQPPRVGGVFGDHPYFNLFSADLSKAVLLNTGLPLTPDATPGTTNMYLREDAGSAARYELLSPGSDSFSTGNFEFVSYGTDDLGVIAFSAEVALLPDSPSGVKNLYVWDHGELTMPSDLPGPGGQMAPNGSQSPSGAVPNLISDDGSRVVFQAPTDGSSPVQVYQRDGDQIHHVSAPQRPISGPDPAGTQPASVVGASADGSRVFFLSSEKLTEDSTASASEELRDLYMYEVETGELTDLVLGPPGQGAVGVSHGGGLVGLSDDGSYVYFVALKPPRDAVGLDRFPESPEGYGLYVWHEGEIRLVGKNGTSSPAGNDLFLNDIKLSQETPDGRSLIFVSNRRLASGDNAGFDALYLYRFGSDEVSCISCPDDGSPMTADAGLGTLRAGFVTGARPPRYISDDGSKVAFATGTSLVPRDANGKKDVYLYENGAVRLVSSGRSSADSYVGDMTPDGSDVLFTTREQLLPQDIDQNLDLYDARVNGGFAAGTTTTAACEGDGCLPPSGTAPAEQAIGSDRAQERSPAHKRCKATRKTRRGKKAAASSRAQERKKPGRNKSRKCRSGK